MAKNANTTQQKTLRLKKNKPADGGEQGADAAPSNTPEPVPAVRGGANAAPASKTPGMRFAAIVALLATLLFASLVFMQYRELKTYQYAFPSPQLQPLP